MKKNRKVAILECGRNEKMTSLIFSWVRVIYLIFLFDIYLKYIYTRMSERWTEKRSDTINQTTHLNHFCSCCYFFHILFYVLVLRLLLCVTEGKKGEEWKRVANNFSSKLFYWFIAKKKDRECTSWKYFQAKLLRKFSMLVHCIIFCLATSHTF